ncbi:TetR/AcrR family transcriptional regulator [Nocardia farcinica]|uniref:TetR/AcrR family transcriptional regulator n=1 Tax=Nocardia farcinica TaxID=37329 RepID=UPI0037BA3CC8
MSNPETIAPARGTRPRNRRALIVAAARELFLADGYALVSMSDVARAVNVSASALYRHFPSKAALLTTVVVDEMQPLREVCSAEPRDIDTLAGQLAAACSERRQLGALWLRETRGLSGESYRELRGEVRSTVDGLSRAIGGLRPELEPEDVHFVATCTYAAHCALSHQIGMLAREDREPEARAILTAILSAPLPPASTETARPVARGLEPAGRRERILTKAVELFADSGYDAVAIEDIGRQAGIAAPTVYHHFPSKQDILLAALKRGDEWLRRDLHQALRGSADARQALERLVNSYIDFAVDHPDHIEIGVSEARHLEPPYRDQIKQTQRDYIQEWVALMLHSGSAVAGGHAAARTHAITAVVNETARTSEGPIPAHRIAALRLIATTLAGL